MAIDALSIPFDIPWKRVAFSRDMFDPRRGGSLPPKWRSSMTVYSYAVPLEDTADDYPDSRIVYFKLSCSITGWAESETLTGGSVPGGDGWVTEAWNAVVGVNSASVYWGCIGAIAQLAIFPRPEENVATHNYPYVMDFEPKKRELYEAVSTTGEVLSGSANRLSTGKSSTSTSSAELSLNVGISVGPISAGESLSLSTSESDTTTTNKDASTERRETQARTAQFSQMYQLFNGYHLGTNRALFVVFPRPHTTSERTDAAGKPIQSLPNNIIVGERKLEGIQEMFLVVHFPAETEGFCLDAWLDTANKFDPGTGSLLSPVVITRRYITGCAEFEDDKIIPIPEQAPLLPPDVIGEFSLQAGAKFAGMKPGEYARSAVDRATETADQLNLLAAEAQRQVLRFQMDESYAARPYKDTQTFRDRAIVPLQSTTVNLSDLETQGHITTQEKNDLDALEIVHSGHIFSASAPPKLVSDIRERLIDALVDAIQYA